MPKLCGRIEDDNYGFSVPKLYGRIETVAKVLPCQSSALSNRQARRPRLRLALSLRRVDSEAVAKSQPVLLALRSQTDERNRPNG